MKLLIAIVVLVAAIVAMGRWVVSNQAETEAIKSDTKPPKAAASTRATKEPGRVVELHTNKGEIDFVLFEKDTPKTTARIADLVSTGAYNGVAFPRADKDQVIQTAECKATVKPMGLEIINYG